MGATRRDLVGAWWSFAVVAGIGLGARIHSRSPVAGGAELRTGAAGTWGTGPGGTSDQRSLHTRGALVWWSLSIADRGIRGATPIGVPR
jgi:hypothetical protein